MYMISARYKGENERKRLLYLLNQYGDKVRKTDSATIFVDNSVFRDFYHNAITKFGSESIKAYKVSSVELKVPKSQKEIIRRIKSSRKRVNDFLRYLFTKLKAIPEKEGFEIYTREGKVFLIYILSEKAAEIEVRIALEGAEEAINRVWKLLSKELDLYEKMQMGKV